MRKWMRERAKRRKGTENTSESTGKIGQSIDPSNPAPLVPSYDSDDAPTAFSEPKKGRDEEDEPHRGRKHESRTESRNEKSEPEGRIEAEPQPDSPSAPAESGDVMRRPPQGKREPRGVVVLTIGLPGSGKTTWFK